jgi:hypothetical protein
MNKNQPSTDNRSNIPGHKAAGQQQPGQSSNQGSNQNKWTQNKGKNQDLRQNQGGNKGQGNQGR